MKSSYPRLGLPSATPRGFFRVCLAFMAALLVSVASAADASTGTVAGRVFNAENGQYLPHAVVRVQGTSLETFTDNYGNYTLEGVPAGQATLTVDFTGQKQLTAPVTVTAGASANQDFMFNRQAADTAGEGKVVKLNEFVVQSERYKNAQQIAINEERYSVNIKNVVAADTFGDIPSGNIGEFVKFLPGVQIDYGAFNGAQTGYSESQPSGISVRGFGPEDTAILIDGMPVSNASPGSLTRQVGLDMLSINNASRVELIKVPTPDMPNNSVGGQVNLITKSAFEYAKPQYTARVFFNHNTLRTAISKSPGPVNKKTYKTTPGAEFSVVYPISKKIGVSFTGFASRQFDQTYRGETTQTTSGSTSITNSAGVLALTNPAMTRFRLTDIARIVDTTSGNVKLDWRPTPSQVLAVNFQFSTYKSTEAQRRLDFRPTLAAGADWGPTYFTGTTANSTTDMTVTTVDKIGDTKSAQLQYTFDRNGWKIYAAGSISQSTGHNRDRQNGHYSEIALKLNPGQVVFQNIQEGIPQSITTYNRVANGGGIRDFTNLSNYSLDGTIAKSGQADSRNTVGLVRLDIERSLDFLRFLHTNSLTFKTGVRRDWEKTEKSGLGTGYREVIDPTKSSIYSVANILDTDYVGVSPGFGFPMQQWGSSYKLFQLNAQNQLFIVPTDGADAVSNWDSYVGQQKSMLEATNGGYAEIFGSFFRHRIFFVGGVRQEQKTREGRGPFVDAKWNYAKRPDGTLYRDSVYPSGVIFTTNAFLNDAALLARMKAANVSYPDHVLGATTTSLESRKLNRVPLRYVNQKITNQPSPSLSTSFALLSNLDLKAAWSRTFKLPSLEDTTFGLVSGNNSFTITENDTIPADGTRGTINVANPGLLPEVSSNWDFQLSYYTKTGGKLSVSYFMKSITNQAQSISVFSSSNPALFDTVLDALGLDPASYQDWRLTTASNSSTVQKTHGYEYEVRQDLGVLPGLRGIGKHFQVFASYSQNSLGQPGTVTPVTINAPNGSVITLTPTVKTITLRSNRFWGAGVQFASRKFSAQVRANYRNQNEQAGNRVTLANGNFLRRIEPSATRVDVNFNYQFTERYSAFLSGRDVFNGERNVIIRDDLGLLPSYAQQFDTKKFGVTWTFGVRAVF